MAALYVPTVMVAVLLRFCVTASIASGSLLIGTDSLSISFVRNSWLGLRSGRVDALKEASASFSIDGVTSFIGPSGSGKSTLGKHICGRANAPQVTGSLAFSTSAGTSRMYRSIYMDPWFYMTYDASKSCLVNLSNPAAEQLGPASSRLLDVKLPWESEVSSLLESERRAFEIILALIRSYEEEGKGGGGSANLPRILVIDEALDKDDIGVKRKTYKFLKSLCSDPDLCLQVFIITHSESIVTECSDWVVALNAGRVFHCGPPDKIRKPAQLVMIQ